MSTGVTDPTQAALLAAIAAAPADDLPRLVYADWLEEHGGGADSWQARRAEFIRLGCEIARLRATPPRHEACDETSACPCARLKRRQAALVAANLIDEWPDDADLPHLPPGTTYAYRRGMIAKVGVPHGRWWQLNGPRLVRRWPLERVAFRRGVPGVWYPEADLHDTGPAGGVCWRVNGWVWDVAYGETDASDHGQVLAVSMVEHRNAAFVFPPYCRDYLRDGRLVPGDGITIDHYVYPLARSGDADVEIARLAALAVADLSRAALAWARAQPAPEVL